MLAQSEAVRRREAARAREREDAERGWLRERRRVMWQCVALSLSGVPLYGLSWHLQDRDQVQLAVAAAFFMSYAFPCIRWFVYHIKCTDRDDY